jgi:hypothetical protein
MRNEFSRQRKCFQVRVWSVHDDTTNLRAFCIHSGLLHSIIRELVSFVGSISKYCVLRHCLFSAQHHIIGYLFILMKAPSWNRRNAPDSILTVLCLSVCKNWRNAERVWKCTTLDIRSLASSKKFCKSFLSLFIDTVSTVRITSFYL